MNRDIETLSRDELMSWIHDLENENEALRRALDETHAELVRLSRVAQY